VRASLFATLDFNLNGNTLPPGNVANLREGFARHCHGVLLFDIWIRTLTGMRRTSSVIFYGIPLQDEHSLTHITPLRCVVPPRCSADKGCAGRQVSEFTTVPRPHTPVHSHPLARLTPISQGTAHPPHLEKAATNKALQHNRDQPAYGLQAISRFSRQAAVALRSTECSPHPQRDAPIRSNSSRCRPAAPALHAPRIAGLSVRPFSTDWSAS